MSLSDIIFFDPSPFETFLAIRPLGTKGSGTQEDPWNCATIPYPAIPVTSLTSLTTTSDVSEASVTAPNHGFSAGDMVTISGVKLTSIPGGLADVFYVGTFQIYDVTTNGFKYTMAGNPSTDSAQPEPGGIQCWREREQFDVVMRSIGPNTTIHLTAGVYETKGFSARVAGQPVPRGEPSLLQPGSWHVKTGQHFRGAGIGVTILKLVNACFAEQDFRPFGHFYEAVLESASIEEMTIDSNTAAQPNQQVSCGAVVLYGSNLRLRRIRAINFSSQTEQYVENFVLMLVAVHPNDFLKFGGAGHNSVIEDCIVERPGANPVNNSTLINNGGRWRPAKRRRPDLFRWICRSQLFLRWPARLWRLYSRADQHHFARKWSRDHYHQGASSTRLSRKCHRQRSDRPERPRNRFQRRFRHRQLAFRH